MNITTEMIEALRLLRDLAAHSEEISNRAARAFDVLDNARVFAAIDASEQSCTCSDAVKDRMRGGHAVVCPVGYGTL